MREYDLNKSYGIGLPEYNRLFEQQNGKCAICGQSAEEKHMGRKKNLCVDHCHDKDTIRGLLCDQCNRAMGLFQDDPEILNSALEYLLKHKLKVA